jgi:nitrate/TMAO reductase-like tetraheme cytochrome c subunit
MHSHRVLLTILAVGGLVIAIAAGCATMRTGGTGSQFVGSEKCAACHAAEYKTWKETNHAKMVRPLKEGLLKDAGDNWAKDSKGTAGPTKGNIDGKPYKMEDVAYVIGSYWKQRYLVKNPATGNHQFLDKQWNRMTKLWENYGQKNDWETQCATCHATGYRLTSYDPKNPAAQKVSMVEHNTGCESCHGPGGKHAESGAKADIFNPAKASKEQASLVCGYCHVRKETSQFRTAQGNVREDQPHPVIGDTYKAGQDDWRTWYPDGVLIPGANPKQPISQNYPKTDLENAFYLDDLAQKHKFYDSRKHHQEWQEYIQSSHYTKNLLSCGDCHTPHALAKPKPAAKDTCKTCHGTTYDYAKIMPATGRTAENLYMRSHTFNKNQNRPGGPTASGTPTYYYK